MRMLRRAGIPEPGSFGPFFFGGAFTAAPGAAEAEAAAKDASRGVPKPSIDASSRRRLISARCIAAASFRGAGDVFSGAAPAHPHELGFALEGEMGLSTPAPGVQLVSMSSGATIPTSPVFHGIGSTDA